MVNMVIDYLYNGQYGVTSDANGLYYMRARYYNIDIKRFINQDILTGSIDSSKSLNRYAYVEGNPISYLEPFGLWKNDESSFFKNVKNIFFYILTDGGTISNGVTFSGAQGGYAGSISAGFSLDSKGNLHFQITGAGGGGAPSAGISRYYSYINAPDLNDMDKWGGSAGGSVGKDIIVGADVITAQNKDLLDIYLA
ncbi:MAG: hypothetical protein E7294_06495 [Lachnospiraceae bacterium]|nr:hypothetical protein [Lachnospiraceae bacterium]